ncbi:Tannase/feruloyl esterase [Aspergillus egyptiacus]|nr:Tannase/feruloyl esterase [Aspergillus egyptiacus]
MDSRSLLACSSLQIPPPVLPGASVNYLTALPVFNKSAYVPETAFPNHGSINVTDASFCLVSLAYTHTHQTDSVHVQVWLPMDDSWNERMMGLGGGGFWCGLLPETMLAMLGAVGEGYAAVSTDCGHTATQGLADWLLTEPGKINLQLLEDFASLSLNEAAIIGKNVAESFYGVKPRYSYWSGCSQGGRQGMMLARRFPDAYDGIVASAPALNWAEILVAGFWTQFVMNQLDEYPSPCELDFLTSVAIAFCDTLDAGEDGIVANIDACNFNPFHMVGVSIACGDEIIPVSRSAAIVAEAAWKGPVTEDGERLGPGVDVVASLTNFFSSQCSANGLCTGLPVLYSSDWIRVAVKKDPNFDLSSITQAEFMQIFNESVKEYKAIIGTDDPDLSAFRQRGGKILAFHGLADPMIPSRGTRRYYESVARVDPHVRSYYRLFEAPGLGHCRFGSSGLYPATIFDDLVAWVEEGEVPRSLPASFTDENGTKQERILCPYPQFASHDIGADPSEADSYFCSRIYPGFHSNVVLEEGEM